MYCRINEVREDYKANIMCEKERPKTKLNNSNYKRKFYKLLIVMDGATISGFAIALLKIYEKHDVTVYSYGARV
jgi:hypothetical protein